MLAAVAPSASDLALLVPACWSVLDQSLVNRQQKLPLRPLEGLQRVEDGETTNKAPWGSEHLLRLANARHTLGGTMATQTSMREGQKYSSLVSSEAAGGSQTLRRPFSKSFLDSICSKLVAVDLECQFFGEDFHLQIEH